MHQGAHMLNRLVERLLAMRFALPVVLLSAAAFLVFTEQSYDRATLAVRNAMQISEGQVAIQRTLRLLIDAETGQRGFVITGREEYLEPYRAAVAELPQAVQQT